MLTHILAVIPTELPPRPVAVASVSLASVYATSLDAVAVGFEKARMPLVAGGSASMPSAYEPEHQQALERATAVLNLVQAEAARFDLPCRYQSICGQGESHINTVCALARLHDLIILAKPDDNLSVNDSFLTRKVLFEAGRPVIFIPPAVEDPLLPKRVGICWDGSRLATRALHDAMPFLMKAEVVEIINVETDAIPIEVSPLRLQQYLAEIGVPSKLMNLVADRSRIVPTILSLAADESIDLLVMGGYGHARLIESVFGGVTFKMLRRMSIPTLMSH